VGDEPVTLKWLWSQHNEHRIFLPRLLYLALVRGSGYDFRAGMYWNALMLIGASAALIVTARRIRARTVFSDAFFPLVLLNWGQSENMLWSFQIAFVLGAVLSIVVLVLVAPPGCIKFSSALALGGCTLVGPLVGGNGVALVPALALCTFVAGCQLPSHRRAPWRRYSVWLLGALALGLFAWYFTSYHQPDVHPVSHDYARTLRAAAQFLAVGFGAGTRSAAPWVTYVTLILWATGGVTLVAVLLDDLREGPRALRLFLFLSALACLAVGTAWARIEQGEGATFASRYATLAAPFWCGLYFVFELTKSRPLRGLAQTCLLLVAAAFVVKNADDGMGWGNMLLKAKSDFHAALRARPIIDDFARTHSETCNYGQELCARSMRALRRHGVGEFTNLREATVR
jgi:hypothetical protein